MGKTIFDFEDQFGIESPFDDWVSVQQKPLITDKAEIVEILIEQGDKNEKLYKNTVVYDNLDPAKYRPKIYDIPKVESKTETVKITISVTIKGLAEAVYISVDGNKQRATNWLNNTYAVFEIEVPKKEGKKKIEISAQLTDFTGKTVLDTKKIIATIGLSGNVLSRIDQSDSGTNKLIKIVIDPGHGYTKGNTGAVSYIYTHKIKGADGEPVLNEKKEFKTSSNGIKTLPAYVINDPDKWIISKKEDPNHNERTLVYDVSVKLKELLENDNFTCFITRNSRVVTGNDDQKTRKARIDLANNNKADYFISIHADGSTNSNATGAHVIYPKTSDPLISKNCKAFASDILSLYNVVNVESTSPKEDERGLQVLGSSNKTPIKVLVELGFVTSPKDANAMFLNIDKIANQLFKGVMSYKSKQK